MYKDNEVNFTDGFFFTAGTQNPMTNNFKCFTSVIHFIQSNKVYNMKNNNIINIMYCSCEEFQKQIVKMIKKT